ncbi:MAG: hypothetical protein ACRETN_02140 [Nevskiales bacterium]
MKIYATIKAAHGALCLNTGFDPLTGPPTKAKLRKYGYQVDAAEYARIQRERHPVCAHPGCPTEALGRNAGRYDQRDRCAAHQVISYGCDNGHRWTATEEAPRDTCPKCGEYYV